MKIIDGKKISNDVLNEIKKHVDVRIKNRKKIPHLAAVLVGEDGPSQTYVNSKIRACERVGFNSSIFKFNDNITEDELLNEITKINENKEIDGFGNLVLPKKIVTLVSLARSPLMPNGLDQFHRKTNICIALSEHSVI